MQMVLFEEQFQHTVALNELDKTSNMRFMRLSILGLFVVTAFVSNAQKVSKSNSPKPISKDLFGIFFEDLSYAADGGLYAELIQNRSFEYSPADRKNWNALTSWEYMTEGFAYGNISVETSNPIHPNNPHYLTLVVEDEGQKGLGLMNYGFDGIVIRAGEQYDFSVFIKQLSDNTVPLSIAFRNKKGTVLGETKFNSDSRTWKNYTGSITATENEDSARLVVLVTGKGKLGIDMVSLFPKKTFKNRKNGLRDDIAQKVAELKPKFMRFPGGCLVHGDGVANIYRWKNTIGPLEQRQEQRNIWNYHQSVGLGYFEYFQFCEDLGAKPLPVVAAAVSCQNSGGTWRIGGTGQKAIPDAEMKEYIQDVLDLIEYANGDVNTKWGAKRAAAGHPQPFGLEYIGIGNEDKQTDIFRDRFQQLYETVKAKHPEITIIGTTGPFHSGEDYDLGWNFANKLNIPMVDEHYYENPNWFLANNQRYDNYDRRMSKVYVGEYASKGNTLFNALAEAAYMTSLERNGDVVTMASYAPLLASQYHTSWNPNLIYFTNTKVLPTVNYYVQQLFSLNAGDMYLPVKLNWDGDKIQNDTTLAYSCVLDSKTNDIIFKIVNTTAYKRRADIELPIKKGTIKCTEVSVLKGDPKAKNSFEEPEKIVPQTTNLEALSPKFDFDALPYSLTIIRLKAKK